jgi:nitrogen fixation/metabolism regulation signal transduction histidine kinase
VAGKKAFERKHYFIDRRFQGRYMLTFLIPMLIMLAFMLITLGTASRSIFNTTLRIVKEDVENTIATQLQDNLNPSVEDYERAINGVTGYLRGFSSNTKFRKALIVSLLWVFGIGVFIVIIETVLLTIYFSHRVAGPVYRFEKTFKAVIEGDYTESIHLRRGDELQNLATLINKAVSMSAQRLRALRDAQGDEAKTEVVDTIKLP